MRNRIVWLTLVAALALPLAAAAQMKMDDQSSMKSQTAAPQRYKLVGTVKSVDPKGHKLIVDHKDIPGYMAAMTMPYNAGKTEDLTKVAPGDHITADVVVASSETHLENIKVTSPASKSKDKE